MKTIISPLDRVLQYARAAKTSAELGTAVNNIEAAEAQLKLERRRLDGELQTAIVAGADTTKPQAAITQNAADMIRLEAAIAGFSDRRTALEQAEEAADLEDLKREAKKTEEDYRKTCQECLMANAAHRAAYAKQDEEREKLTRLNARLEAKGVRGLVKPAAIARQTIG